MTTFTYIIIHIQLPIFLLVCVGFISQKKLKMDVRTFSKVNIYIFVPAVLFVKIYEAKVTMDFIGMVLFYIFAIEAVMLLLGEVISRINHYPRSKRKAFCNTLLFFNSGNYGLPLVELVFKGSAIASMSQIFIMLVQNITTSTIGVFQASSGSSSYKQAIKNVLVMPSIYVLPIVFIVKFTGITVVDSILIPLKYLSNGFIAIALLTLGVQLADIKISFNFKDIALSSFIRLILSPIIGVAIVLLLKVHGDLAKALIIGASTPTAVNTAIIAREFNNEPEYCARAVLFSTIFSAVTISVIVIMVNTFIK